MKKLTLDEVKRLEIELLEFTTGYLDSRGLYYSLYGGTLLGAVRHKGFIPWDDDIDICMPRDDFKRFVKCAEDMPYPYRIIDGNSCEAFCLPFAKVQDVRYKTREGFSGTYPQRLWIDVFPLDGVPDSDAEQMKLLGRLDKLKRAVNACWFDPSDEKKPAKRLMRKCVRHLAGGRIEKTVRSKRDSLIQRMPFDQSEYVSCLASSCRKPWRVPREEFMKPLSVEFAGRCFRAMSCTDTFLSAVYGNYMELPPEGQRVNHELEVWGPIEPEQEDKND